METELIEEEIKAKLAELAEQQGLKARNEWPVYMWIWDDEKKEWDYVNVAKIDHAWYVEVNVDEGSWALPVVAFEIVSVIKLMNLSLLKKDLENIRISGAALGVLVIQAASEEKLQQELREQGCTDDRIRQLRDIISYIVHPIRVGIAYAGDIIQGKLRIAWLSTLE